MQLLFIPFLIFYLCLVAGQSPCSTPIGKTGSCVTIYECNSLLKLTRNATRTEIEFLRDSLCGFTGKNPMVCCPSGDCTSPDGGQGTCIGLDACPHLMNVLRSSSVQTAMEFVQTYRCDGPDDYSVCCNPQLDPILTADALTAVGGVRQNCQLTAFPPQPNTECCGLEASGGTNRIVGGSATAVDEYPWLALIEYAKGYKIKLLCGGVLISGRYVMTAAHCLVGPVLNAATPANVRLGEYDTSNPDADCVEVAGGGQDCNDGTVIIPIEKSVIHPDYNPKSSLRRHDIALIRLARIVEFTDFVRPICLPNFDFTSAPQENLTLYTAGWGAVSDVQSSSNVKLKVRLPYVSYKDCQVPYSVPGRRVPLWEGQICAGGERGKDSCRGDSGGPLMRQNGRIFEVVGIVSFGPTPCGKENAPGVYSNVFHYIPWIESQIVV